jgi:hypothetical protein
MDCLQLFKECIAHMAGRELHALNLGGEEQWNGEPV